MDDAKPHKSYRTNWLVPDSFPPSPPPPKKKIFMACSGFPRISMEAVHIRLIQERSQELISEGSFRGFPLDMVVFFYILVFNNSNAFISGV